MHICPTCNEPGITTWAKCWSGTLNPAICAKCRGKSYPNPSATSLFGIALEVSFVFFGWVALAMHSWLPLLSVVLIFMAGKYAILRWVPLVKHETVGSIKGWQLAVIAAISVLLFVPVFWLVSAAAGEGWGAGIALIGMLIVIPVFGLRFFSRKT